MKTKLVIVSLVIFAASLFPSKANPQTQTNLKNSEEFTNEAYIDALINSSDERIIEEINKLLNKKDGTEIFLEGAKNFFNKLLEKERFVILNWIADKLRDEKIKAYEGDGNWILHPFYSAVTSIGRDKPEEEFEKRIRIFKKWIKERPSSPTPRIALATLYVDYAWRARGSGSGHTVTLEGGILYSQRLEEAKKALSDSEVVFGDPEAYRLQVHLTFTAGDSQNRESVKKEAYEWFERGIRFEPEYLPLYRTMANFLLIRWFGEKDNEWIEFLRKYTPKTDGTKGKELFVKTAYSNIFMQHPYDFYSKYDLSWDEMKSMFDQILEINRNSKYYWNLYCLFAYYAMDFETAQVLFNKIEKIGALPSLWHDPRRYRRAKSIVSNKGRIPFEFDLSSLATGEEIKEILTVIDPGGNVADKFSRVNTHDGGWLGHKFSVNKHKELALVPVDRKGLYTIKYGFRNDATGKAIEIVKTIDIETGEIQLIKTTGGKSFIPIVSLDAGGHMGTISKAFFIKGDRQIVTTSQDKTVRIWDIEKGESVKVIRGHSGEGSEGAILEGDIADNGRLLAVAGIFDDIIYSLSDKKSNIGNIHIFDLQTGEIVKVLEGHNSIVRSLDISEDGKFLTSLDEGGELFLWDVDKGTHLHKMGFGPMVTFSTDSKRILSCRSFGAGGKKCGLWDTSNGNLIASIEGKIDSALFIGKGSFLLTSGADGVVLWDAVTGYLKRIIASDKFDRTLKVNEERVFLVGERTIRTVEFPSGKTTDKPANTELLSRASVVSTDGRIAAILEGNDLVLVDVEKGTALKTLKGRGVPIQNVGISKDNKRIAWGIRGLETGFSLMKGKEYALSLIGSITDSSEFTEGIKEARGISIENAGTVSVSIIVKKEGNQIAKISSPKEVSLTSFSLTPDGKMVIGGYEDGTIILYNTSNGTVISTLKGGHTAVVTSLAVSQDGHYLVSGSLDCTVKLWELDSKRLVLTIFADSDEEWVAWTPEGFFDASKKRARNLAYVMSRGRDKSAEHISLEETYDIFYRPDLVSLKLKTRSSSVTIEEALMKAKANVVDLLIKTTLPPEITIISPKDRTCLTKRDILLEARIMDKGGGIGKIIYEINGTLLDITDDQRAIKIKGTERKEDSIILKKWLILRPGDNEITVTAFNRKDDGASDSKSIVLTLKDERPVLGQTRPEVFPQIGHLGQVFSIAFSPDGRLAISGSDDKKIKIWDVVTGRLIWTLLGHSRQVVSVVFSPDGRLALSGSDDKTARLWNVATGQVMHILQGHSAMVSSVAFSPDCRLALTGSWDDTLKIWEVVTGREIRTLRGHSNSVASVAFSPDGRLVLSGSRDKTIKVWDVASGQIIKTLEGHSDMVMSVAFSPDGRIAISGSYDKTVKLWDVDKGQEVRTLRGHSQVLRRVAFSQNGRLALSGDADQTLKVWDVNTGRELKTLGGGHTGGIVAVAFSPDGRLVLSSGWDWAIKLLDTGTGQEIRTLGGGYANWILSVAVSPDGRVALSGSGDKTIKVWDLASGRQVKTLEGHSGWVKSVAFSPDGRLAVSGSSDRTVKIWDLDSGQELRTIRGDADNLGFNSVAFSSDGKFVLSAGWITHSVSPLKSDQIVKVWDVASGQEIRTLNGHRRMGERAFSPDGRLALFDSDDKKSVKVLDLSSGKVVQLLRGYIPSRGAFSSDGRLILFGQSDGTINLWDVESNREMWKLRAHEQRTLLGYENQITELAFSSDNRLAITGSGLGEVKVWDVTYGHEILALGGHGDWVSSVSFSPDGRLAISGSGDGTVRVWDVASGQELNQMVGFNEGEWVTITPEGYYAASLRGHEFLNVRWKNSVYGINQFYDVFYRPDIVEQKLKGKDISDLITVTIEDAIKKPPPEVEFIGAPKTTTKSSETISYKVKSAGGGIGEIRVFHNGKLIQSDGHYRNRAGAQQKNNRIEDLNSSAIYAQLRGIALIERTVPSPIVSRSKGNIYEGAVEIEPVAGENIVSIAAFNADNTVQSYMKSVTFQAEVKLLTPHLYILAIGTDRYKYHRINLKYAAKDASEITSMLVKEAGVAFDPGNVHHQVLVDEQATKPKILSKIEELAKKTRPTDTFILFVAGHGILTGDQYFMVTHDYDGNLGDDCLISSNEIVEASKKLKALNQLIIFDTCHAGGVDHVINGLYDARMSVLARKMGLHVYAAASSVQEAIDGYRGNGLFSHTLLKGLNNNRTADQNTDSQVSVVELGQYSKTQTAEISTRIGHRQIPLIISFGRDLSLYRLR